MRAALVDGRTFPIRATHTTTINVYPLIPTAGTAGAPERTRVQCEIIGSAIATGENAGKGRIRFLYTNVTSGAAESIQTIEFVPDVPVVVDLWSQYSRPAGSLMRLSIPGVVGYSSPLITGWGRTL